MKILILGARGSLGTQLVKIFSEDRGNKITAWGRSEIDITDKDLILKKVKELKPDIIINSAAHNAVDKCEEDDEEFKKALKINSQAVGYLADSAMEVDALLIHFSSDYVFDGKQEDGYREDAEPDPISRYGESKLGGEEEIIRRSGKGLKHYLIRVSKLFGPKAESSDAKPGFFDLILDLSQEKKEFKMVHGEELSCFTYTPDLAKKVKELIDKDAGYGIYHIVNSSPATWYDGAKYMFEILERNDVSLIPCKMEDYPRPAKRPKYSVLLNTKLEPMRDWKEALKEYLVESEKL